MEEMKYECKERGIGHVGDGKSTRGDYVTVVSYNLSKTIIIIVEKALCLATNGYLVDSLITKGDITLKIAITGLIKREELQDLFQFETSNKNTNKQTNKQDTKEKKGILRLTLFLYQF